MNLLLNYVFKQTTLTQLPIFHSLEIIFN